MSPQSKRLLVEDLVTVVGTIHICSTACCKLHNTLAMSRASAKLVPSLLAGENKAKRVRESEQFVLEQKRRFLDDRRDSCSTHNLYSCILFYRGPQGRLAIVANCVFLYKCCINKERISNYHGVFAFHLI